MGWVTCLSRTVAVPPIPWPSFVLHLPPPSTISLGRVARNVGHASTRASHSSAQFLCTASRYKQPERPLHQGSGQQVAGLRPHLLRYRRNNRHDPRKLLGYCCPFTSLLLSTLFYRPTPCRVGLPQFCRQDTKLGRWFQQGPNCLGCRLSPILLPVSSFAHQTNGSRGASRPPSSDSYLSNLSGHLRIIPNIRPFHPISSHLFGGSVFGSRRPYRMPHLHVGIHLDEGEQATLIASVHLTERAIGPSLSSAPICIKAKVKMRCKLRESEGRFPLPIYRHLYSLVSRIRGKLFEIATGRPLRSLP